MNNGFAIPHTLGTKAGGNLFHSFTELNLVAGESATFSGPGDVANVLARVTGGSASSIDGTLRSTIPGASLFLMNPKGVLFGPNAKLDVSGSFTVTTADYAKLSDGKRFNAVPGSDDLTLSAAPISAFGFVNPKPAAVTFNQSQLSVPDGAGLSVIAGDITLDGATLDAPGGNLSLFSARSSGELAVPPANPTTQYREPIFPGYGDIVLRGGATAMIDSARGGGKVVIRGGKLTVTDLSTIRSINQGGNTGGDVELTAETMAIRQGGQIFADTAAIGKGGNVTVTADSLSIDGGGFPFDVGIFTDGYSTGHAGDVVVKADRLEIFDNGVIQSNTFGRGDGGSVSVTANSLTIDGDDSFVITGISARAQEGSRGRAGNVRVQADVLKILNHGSITSETFGLGSGGGVSVMAGSLSIDGGTTKQYTGIAANANRTSQGDAGDVVVKADQIRLRNGEISASAFSSGDGGSVSVTAGSLSIDGVSVTTGFTGIAAQADSGSSGNAGDVVVQAGDLRIINDGFISTTTLSSGKAGSVSVTANSLSILSAGSIESLTKGSGNGGGVSVTANSLFILNTGSIESGTFSSGDGGSVSVQAGSLSINSTGVAGFTGISAQANGDSSGNAGDVVVRAGDLEIIYFGLITSGTFGSGNGGSVSVTADALSIDGLGARTGFTGISAQANRGNGNAGDVMVDAGDVKILNLGKISSSTFSSGNGGGVSVTAGSLSIDGGGVNAFTGISAQADRGSSGNAGDVVVRAGDLQILHLGQITSGTSSSGNGGSVSVTANSLSIAGRGPDLFTGISARADNRSTGIAGDVVVTADDLALRNNASITAASATGAPSGSVRISAENVRLDSASIVSSENTGSGDAGSVQIQVRGDLRLENAAVITVAAVAGNAGQIDLQSGAEVTLFNGSRITASAGLDGGSISLQTRDLLYLRDSSITATAGTARATGRVAGGTGGNIFIDPVYVVLDHGLISANAAIGAGGNILLRAQNFLSSESPITATGTTAGTVTIAAPELDLSAALAVLAAQFVDASARFQERCALRLGTDASTFLVLGRGSAEASPEEVPVEIVARIRPTGIGRVRTR